MKKTIFILTAMAALLVACESPEAENSGSGKKGGISFTTGITRAVGNQWEVNDSVGVFQIPEGGNFTTAISKNTAYSTPDGDGNFTSKKPLYYPEGSATNYDFVAYYPYKKGITNNYPVEVGNQANINKLDLLYAKTTGQNEGNTTVKLQFKHCLTNLVVEVKAGKDVTSLENLSVTLTGSPTRGVFNLEDGSLSITDNTVKDIAMKMSFAADKLSAQAEAIVIPSTWTGCTLVFKVPEQGLFTYEFKEGAFLKGKKYKLVATLSKEGTIHGVELEGLDNTIDNWDTEGGDMGSINGNFKGDGGTPEPDPDGTTGDGSKENPYSVSQILDYENLNLKKNIYVTGYVVGVCNYSGQSLFSPMTEERYDAFQKPTASFSSHILLGDTNTERAPENLLSITGYKNITDLKTYLLPKDQSKVTILLRYNSFRSPTVVWAKACAALSDAVEIPLTFK